MPSDTHHSQKSIRQILLRIPLLYKILIANSAIVAVGAIAGTFITAWYAHRNPGNLQLGLMVLFGTAGIIISFAVNSWVLQRALKPLDRLQDAVDEVHSGQPNVRVELGDNTDDRFDRLADTFNRMLDKLEENARQLKHVSGRIIQAQEEERRRLARELHDEAAQALTSLLVHLRLLERAKTPDEAQGRVKELRELTAQALEEVRRVSLDLRPTILDDLGLGPALEWRVDEFNRAHGMEATIEVQGIERRLPRNVELVFYRVGQESLSNVARHAGADAVDVSLVQCDSVLTIEIIDDGCGFEPKLTNGDGPRGLGLVGMRERLAMIDGELIIESAPGNGTRVVASAPAHPALVAPIALPPTEKMEAAIG